MNASFLDQRGLPLVINYNDDSGVSPGLETLISMPIRHREFLQRKLLECGALLLRGFPVLDAFEFGQFVRGFSGKNLLDYVSGASPRIKLGGGVYTSTEYPRHYTLSLHNELSYTYQWPDHLFFCCVTASKQGGETPLGDSRAILKSIDKEVVNQFRSKQVMYVRNLHGGNGDGYSWQEAFETDDRSVVEEYFHAGGIRFKWEDDGVLRLNEVRPATAVHPATGDEVWFNQADGFHPSGMDPQSYKALISIMGEEKFRLNAYFGDGTPINPSVLDHIREVLRKNMVLVSWRAGDILILDNMLTSHGRMPFRGERKILLAMT
jgi:alpha-ketoglutarate-dependent taurine dioxygenase